MNANYDTLTIDLSVVRGAVGLPIEAQLFPEEMNRAIRLVTEFAEAADGRQKQWDQEQKDMPWKDPELLHEALLVSGPRGSGKTTFLLSIFQQFNKTNAGNISVLPLLDPTLVPSDDMFIGAVIANILRRVDGHSCSKKPNRTLETALQRLSGGLVAAHPDVWKARLNVAASDSSYAEHLLRFSRDGLNLRVLFGNFVAAAADHMGVSCFVQPIDDVDVAGKNSWTVLETVRRHLTTPRILPIITGHLPQFRAMVLEEKLGEVTRRRGIKAEEGSEAKEALEEARALANQHLLKLIRPERRILLTSARDALKLRHSVKVHSGGSQSQPYLIEDLLRRFASWLNPYDVPEVTLDLLPENARLMRAFITWVMEAESSSETDEQRAFPPAFYRADTWIGLLDIDGEAQETQGWRIDDQVATAGGDYRPLLRFLLNPKNIRRANFHRETFIDAPWQPLIIDLALMGILRARFSGRNGIARALAFWIQLSYPVALCRVENTRPDIDETRKRLIQSISGASVTETALLLAAHRWPENPKRSVHAGLAVISDKKTAEPTKNPVLEKIWRQHKKLEISGHGPWIHYLLESRRLKNLHDWVKRANVTRGRGPYSSPYDQLVLRLDQIEYLLTKQRSPQATNTKERHRYRQQWQLVNLVLSLYQSRVGSGNAELQLADPIGGIAAICSILMATTNGNNSKQSTSNYVETLLTGLQTWHALAHTSGTEDIHDNGEQETDDEDGEDPEADSDNHEAVAFSDDDPTHHEAKTYVFPRGFTLSMAQWVLEMQAREHVDSPRAIHPGILAAVAKGVVDAHLSNSIVLGKVGCSVGSFLHATILSLLNVLLTTENIDGIDFKQGKFTNYISFKDGKYQPSGAFSANIDTWKREQTFRSDGRSQTHAYQSSLFYTIASCPIIHAVLLPPWSKKIAEAIDCPWLSPNLQSSDEEHWRNINLTAWESVEGGSRTRNEVVDIATLLHAIPIHKNVGEKAWVITPWLDSKYSVPDDLRLLFEDAHLAARGKRRLEESERKKVLELKSSPSNVVGNQAAASTLAANVDAINKAVAAAVDKAVVSAVDKAVVSAVDKAVALAVTSAVNKAVAEAMPPKTEAHEKKEPSAKGPSKPRRSRKGSNAEGQQTGDPSNTQDDAATETPPSNKPQ